MKAQPGMPKDSPVTRHKRHDDPDWHWLEQRDAPATRAFLEDANQAHERWFRPLAPLASALYQDHLSRRELAVKSLEAELDVFAVWSETGQDDDYPRWWRRPLDQGSAPACFFDVVERAGRHAFFDIGDMALAPDEQWLAWSEDTQGDERYTLWLKALPDGEPHKLADDIGPALCWAEDQTPRGATLLFTRFDSTQRPDSLWRCQVDFTAPERPAPATLVFREEDAEFWLGMGKTRSKAWLLIETSAKDTTEILAIPADAPNTPPRLLHRRIKGVEVSIDHRPGAFYRLHNQDGPHFALDTLAEAAWEKGDAPTWQTLIAHDDARTLEGMDAYAWGLIVAQRSHDEAQTRLRRLVLDGLDEITVDTLIALPETPCSQLLEDSAHFDTTTVRLREESFTRPASWYELDLESGDRRHLKTVPVHGGLKPEALVSRRIWASAPDGERVPVSIVMRADLADQPLPTLLYGYGAYGEPLDPWFSIARLSLLERGVAFAVAHVRGGGERGEPWYLDGKMAHKENSFDDFLAARQELVDEGLSQAKRIVAVGASAGGLLVGACVNRAPQAFCAAVLDVPFLDVLRTMQNPDLPLTTAEYSEWGNPAELEVEARLRGYSPMDNIQPQAYPALWIEGNWFDTRVGYWEPAKFYARVSQAQRGDAPILLHTDMDSGHGGASGRFKSWQDAARQDAFILWALGLADAPV
ncbi:S9 family peptidase [Halomonas malpeensis]|uniref:S9 family peptidase n=2 Tax=Vreelandella malpeensis TaxID=1172368 RepID=A0ABS8DQK5_9GAMM|nr:S9 family peptidase [Halomonas malpeensis]